MAVQRIQIDEFLRLAEVRPVIDVRSPGEFTHAHIPGAFSLPLFSDEERKIVGTLYKQESREKAIKKGLEFFGVKMVRMVEEMERLTENNEKVLLIHCWRGGMRSAAVAWLMDLYGFKVYTLAGGYKLFRQWVLKSFEKEYPFKLLGGYTGSRKTLLLEELKGKGEIVIDLEDLACHKGSAFGAIDMPPQPSQEMFENKLAIALNNCCSIGSADGPLQTIWLEDESQRIGLVNIPIELWKQMRNRPLVFVQIPFEERLKYIVKDYGKGHKEKLISAIVRIKKRLGGLETKNAVNFLLEDDLTESFRILLQYYDKLYLKGLQKRENLQEVVSYVECTGQNLEENAKKILATEKQIINA